MHFYCYPIMHEALYLISGQHVLHDGRGLMKYE